jgi:hypothetical protein
VRGHVVKGDSEAGRTAVAAREARSASFRERNTPAAAPAAVKAGTVTVPAGTFNSREAAIPPGANRVELDLVNFDGETGRSTGILMLPGYANDSNGDVYVWQERPGGPWKANALPGTDAPNEVTARDPHELMAKVARLYGITGTTKVEDERTGDTYGRYNLGKAYSGTRDLSAASTAAPATKPTGPARGSLEAKIAAKEAEIERRVGSVAMAKEARIRSTNGGRIQSSRESKANAALSQARRELSELQRQRIQARERQAAALISPSGRMPAQRDMTREEEAARQAANPVTYRTPPARRVEAPPRTEAFDPRKANGGNLPGRIEGESDTMYSVRVASNDDQARRILDGLGAAGLRALANTEGVPGYRSKSKTQLIDALMSARRAYWDSIAISRRG